MIPIYYTLNQSEELNLFRKIKHGGDLFIRSYIERFSERESDTSFDLRKSLTPSAAFAKREVIKVQNAIYQRLVDIIRVGGSDSYQQVVSGEAGGIDLDNSSMSHFIGQDVLNELLFLGKVGVLVDMPKNIGTSVSETAKDHPYCYIYQREQILNWTKDQINNRNTLTALRLSEYIPILDDYGLPEGDEIRYRVYNRLENSVRLRIFNKNEELQEDYIIDVPEIPFILFEIPDSLLHETGKYQIALMNMESSDISYSLKANFPILVRKADPLGGSHIKKNDDGIEVGNIQGMEYSGEKEPGFINPSSEPLKASIAKQEQIKESIQTLISSSVASISQKSAASKEFDERGLESGLSAIGEILEHGEQKIAIFYSLFEGSKEVATINYPNKYSLKSDEDKINEVKLLQEQKDEMPSIKGKKALAKMAAHTLFDTKLPVADLKIIIDEIEESNNTGASAKTINADVEAGILGHETAALMRGYNKNEPTKAAIEHADRLARIEEAQTRARENTAARGVLDKAPDKSGAIEEKKQSQDPNLDGDGKNNTRGEGKWMFGMEVQA